MITQSDIAKIIGYSPTGKRLNDMSKLAETIRANVLREMGEVIKARGWFGTDWERHIPERMGYKGKSGYLVFFTEDDIKHLEEE